MEGDDEKKRLKWGGRERERARERERERFREKEGVGKKDRTTERKKE